MEDRDSLQRLGELQRREAREYRALAAQHASTAERLRAEAHQLDALARQEGDRASESESFARHIDAFLAGRAIGLSWPAPVDVDTEEEEEEETTEEGEVGMLWQVPKQMLPRTNSTELWHLFRPMGEVGQIAAFLGHSQKGAVSKALLKKCEERSDKKCRLLAAMACAYESVCETITAIPEVWAEAQENVNCSALLGDLGDFAPWANRLEVLRLGAFFVWMATENTPTLKIESGTRDVFVQRVSETEVDDASGGSSSSSSDDQSSSSSGGQSSSSNNSLQVQPAVAATAPGTGNRKRPFGT